MEKKYLVNLTAERIELLERAIDYRLKAISEWQYQLNGNLDDSVLWNTYESERQALMSLRDYIDDEHQLQHIRKTNG